MGLFNENVVGALFMLIISVSSNESRISMFLVNFSLTFSLLVFLLLLAS